MNLSSYITIKHDETYEIKCPMCQVTISVDKQAAYNQTHFVDNWSYLYALEKGFIEHVKSHETQEILAELLWHKLLDSDI